MYRYLSECYDLFMLESDYDNWLEKAVSVIGPRRKGIDCGCGSGAVTIRLKKLGYDVMGIDISPEMLDAAVKNAARQNVSVTFINMDCQKLIVGNKVDFITAVCDVVNYMKNPLSFFRAAYKALKKDGVLFFDISSSYKLINIIGNNVFTDSTSEVTYVWNNTLSEKLDKVDMDLTFFVKNASGTFDKKEESQTQYIYSEQSILSWLKVAGFSDINIFGENKGESVENEQRIYFAAYKQE